MIPLDQINFTMKKAFLIVISLIISANLFSQEKVKDTLKTDEIIVVKPYTPTISDAFKIKDNPTIGTDEIKKEDISYTFFSVPVASTFTPTKGKAQSVVREPLDKIYDNFVAAGFGNYSTPYLEAFLHSSSSKTNDFGAYIKHKSSKGGIKDILLDDNYSDSYLNLYYRQFERDYNWELFGGAQHQIRNWYGLPKGIVYDQNLIDTIDPKQKYLNIFFGGNLSFQEGVFKDGTIVFNHFSDDYGSGEFHFLATPTFEFPISSEIITMESSVEYINSKFEQSYFVANELEYSLLNIGATPNFEILREDLSINLGVKVYYSFDFVKDRNQFYFYPNVTASYKLVDETVILFTGITGDLEQNSYQKFTENNPFVSPTINLLQTDKKYNAFLGAKGKISSSVNYNIVASYQSEKDKTLMINNPTKTDGTIIPTMSYEAGNSFSVVYDDVETLTVSAEINIDVSKEFSFGGIVEFNNYTTTNQDEAWNLPTISSTLFAKYNTKKWYLGSDLYFVGERKDFIIPFANVGEIKTLSSYVDLNFNGGYMFTDRLTAFAKINNVLSTNYERYTNFEVQGIQALAGIIYKFDF